MNHRCRHGLTPTGATAALAVLCVLLGSPAPAVAQHDSAKYEGRRLTEALRVLQSAGLRIVFSSETVTADMRVATEPRATAPRQKLDELLEPHGLKAQEGPGRVIQIVRAKSAKPVGTRKRSTAVSQRTEGDGFGARGGFAVAGALVEVVGTPDVDVGSDMSVGRRDLEGLAGVMADDPMRAVHALPGVAASDDFRSEFSVRGSPYRHVGVVIDGVATPWLQHTAYDRGDTGSLAMLPGDVLEHATLHTGAYPHRYGDRLGAQLAFSVRHGSRTATAFRGALSGTNAMLVAEGPMGRLHRGSWLFTLRQSYRDWPVQDLQEFAGTVFGFTDAQAKLAYDVRPTQQATLTVIGGRSYLDERDDRPMSEFGDGANRAAVVNLGWRSTFGSRLVLTQRAYFVDHSFLNKRPTEQEAGRGSNRDLSYRADVTRSMWKGLFEAGGQIQRLHASRQRPSLVNMPADPERQTTDAFGASSWTRSGYVHFQWRVTPHVAIAPGVRVADSTLVQKQTISRWILGEWSWRPGWTLNASTGVSHQFPDFEHVLGAAGSREVTPERAAHVDVGIEQRLGRSLRWKATLFNRRERDVLRGPELTLPGHAVDEPQDVSRYTNALRGSFRGVELMLERRSAIGLSGWASYAYGTSRYTDAARGETFWADFDQRHAVNVSGVYRLSDRTTVSGRFRGGSNFPVPGYLAERGGALFAGERRNEVRLPADARLDLRATRTFRYAGRRITVFAELINVLNRTNVGLSDGFIRGTGEATGFTEPLFRRRPSAGVVIEF